MARREIDQFTVPRKVSKIRWLEGSVFPQKDLHFATALHLDGKADTLAIWNCENQRQFEITRAEDVKAGFNPKQLAEISHRGEVLDMRVIDDQEPLLVTASSLGEINLYKSKIQANSSTLQHVATHRHHGFPNLGVAGATSLSIRPQALNEIASVGEDSRLVLIGSDNIQKTLQRSDRVSSGLSAVCWRSSSSIAVATKSGQVRLFDRRDISKSVSPVLQDPRQLDPLTCIAQHPTDVHKLTTGNDEGALSIWDVRNMSKPEVKAIKVHNSIVWEVMFHPNQPDKLISSSQDGTLATVNWKQALNEYVSDATGTKDECIATYWSSITNVLSVNSIDYHNRANILLAGADSGGILHSVQ
ncbi:Nucleoporin Nup43 [Mortierella sp. AD011]|nr:Nucleoporin Nup43 [Mortierella sp. AD010]KAF9398078.1 Nucleoporin Nup43 [Mortierella sp. AD011]